MLRRAAPACAQHTKQVAIHVHEQLCWGDKPPSLSRKLKGQGVGVELFSDGGQGFRRPTSSALHKQSDRSVLAETSDVDDLFARQARRGAPRQQHPQLR